jgi:hypothetical protein
MRYRGSPPKPEPLLTSSTGEKPPLSSGTEPLVYGGA